MAIKQLKKLKIPKETYQIYIGKRGNYDFENPPKIPIVKKVKYNGRMSHSGKHYSTRTRQEYMVDNLEEFLANGSSRKNRTGVWAG